MQKEFSKDKYFSCYAGTLSYLIDKTSIYLRLRGSILLAELGADITLEQFITLDAISVCKNLCQRDLAKILLKDRSNVTRILNILEHKGLIQRITVSKGNRIVKSAELTKAGYEMLNKTQNKMKNDFNELMSNFSASDLKTLEKVLNEISSKISEKASIQI